MFIRSVGVLLLLAGQISYAGNDDQAVSEAKLSELAGCMVGLSFQRQSASSDASREAVKISLDEAEALVNETVSASRYSGISTVTFKKELKRHQSSFQSRINVISAMPLSEEEKAKSIADDFAKLFSKCMPYLKPIKLKSGETALVRP